MDFRYKSPYKSVTMFRYPDVAAILKMPETHPLSVLRVLGDALLSADIANTDVLTLNNLILQFTKNFLPKAVTRTHDQIWYKARPCKDEIGFMNLREMIYNPSGCPEFGRAQLEKEPVIYGGWNPLVALAEVVSQPGKLYQVIAFRPRFGEQVCCHVVGEYDNYNRTGRSLIRDGHSRRQMAYQKMKQPLQFEQHAYIDSVIASLFARKVDNPQQYKLTAVYADIYSGKNGAIIFPSVKRSSDFNIAVHKRVFDAQFEVVLTHLSRIPQNGVDISCPVDREVHEFTPNGDIDWSSMYRRSFTFSMQAGNRESPVTDGWRVPDVCTTS